MVFLLNILGFFFVILAFLAVQWLAKKMSIWKVFEKVFGKVFALIQILYSNTNTNTNTFASSVFKYKYVFVFVFVDKYKYVFEPKSAD